jgi:predicted protein tyrosine phosphatase
MTIVVCPLSKVDEMIARHAPGRIVSLLDPEFTFPDAGPQYVGRHLTLCFHDIHLPGPGQIMPRASHIEDLLSFIEGWESSAPLLIHCRAGISRSTAAAFIAACFLNPDTDERAIAGELRRASPLARPNSVLVRLADIAMSRNGRMYDAIAQTGRGLPWIDVHENVAFEMPSIYAVNP